MDLLAKVVEKQIRKDLPEFRVGDQVNVGVRIVEGKRERIQYFEGIVIAIKGSGIAKNFIVRSMKSGVGAERTFPFNSPKVESIKVIRKGKVRQAKLGYLRNLKKEPRIKERN